MENDPQVTLRMHTWFDSDRGMLFSHGRVLLLQKVVEQGSLNKAAQTMGMSYRAAWGKIKKTEAALGGPLLEKASGRKGFELSALGRELLNAFATWQQEVEDFALQRANELFDWEVHRYVREPKPKRQRKK